ncbi:efflux RND transporter periplasmic adaptor subunit [Anoxybacterium hadale]|uniref:Efflux RND transporter periplasmic adaptor subunit n=1 Tax=Anoxybacterium hadale TaxID=3408580 RepID=A0ACD1AFB0_9FIRM|nr:efflux RND transporter periplasmic adaptor subunit [Clostridiales bacterium]
MMHFTKKKTVFLLVAVLAVGTISAAAWLGGGKEAETAAVDKGEVKKILKENGTVESKSAVTIMAKNAGEIKGLMVDEGDRIEKGAVLMLSDGTSAALDIKSQQAELSGLQAQYSQAKELADKNRLLYEQGALSYEAYNTSNTEAKQLAAQISALRYSIESYAQSTGSEGVTAPVAGVVTAVYVKEGASVAVGAPLFEISNLDDIYVKTDVIAEDADLIQEGDSVKIYNTDSGFSDELASVRKIHIKAEDKLSDLGVSQKRVTVEIAFGSDKRARLGSSLDVEITVEQKENALRVPELAVFVKEKENYVYLLENGKAVLKQVETGLEGEDYYEVLSGLAEGDQVILSPGDDISGGIRIKTKD